MSKVAGVVSAKTPEIRPSAVPDSGEEDQHPGDEEHSGEKNNPEGAGDKGRRFATSPLHRGRANKSRRARLSDFNSKSIF